MNYIDKYHFKRQWECNLAEEKIVKKYGKFQINTWSNRCEIQIILGSINRDGIIKILREYDGAFST